MNCLGRRAPAETSGKSRRRRRACPDRHLASVGGCAADRDGRCFVAVTSLNGHASADRSLVIVVVSRTCSFPEPLPDRAESLQEELTIRDGRF